MATFTTRIELHGSRDPKDYDRLHAAMEALGFRRQIIGDDGQWYWLPTATYYSSGDLTASQVRSLAKSAAAKTGLNYWILVTEEVNRAWELVPVASVNALTAPKPILDTLYSLSPPQTPLNALSSSVLTGALAGLYKQR
jgi:hypothetical protein